MYKNYKLYFIILVVYDKLVKLEGFMESKNLLILLSDEHNKRMLGAVGHSHVRTPNLDKLASEGVLFENAHVQYPLCGPSRISLMTGLYPDQTKSKDLRLFLRQTIPDVITIGQRFIMEKCQTILTKN